MTNHIQTKSIAILLTTALALTACGKQEAVSDVPSSEELARQADAASKAIRDEAAANDGQSDKADAVDSAEMESYANALRGYSILVPKDWAQDESASDDDGRTYKNESGSTTLTVGWTENREDAALQAAVKSLEDAGVTGEFVKEDEYRATGTPSEGKKTMQRILRKPDGTMVRAAINYAEGDAGKLDAMAERVLKSLTLL